MIGSATGDSMIGDSVIGDSVIGDLECGGKERERKNCTYIKTNFIRQNGNQNHNSFFAITSNEILE